MNRRRAVASVGFVFMALLVTSCSNDGDGGTSGAALGEVATAFEQDVQKLADDFLGNNSVGGTKLEVSSDGKSDVPCESGQAKRVYDASFPMLDRGDGTGLLFGMKVNSYDKDYTITKARDQASDAPEAELKRKDQPFTVAIKVDRSAKAKMTIHAETECLDAD